MDNDEKRRQNGGYFAVGNNEGVKISKENQPSPEAKSEGWKKRNLREKLIEQTAEELFGAEAPKIAVCKAIVEAEEKGNVKPLIDLLKLIKKPDKLELDSNIDVKQLVLEVVGDGAGTGTDEDNSEILSAN